MREHEPTLDPKDVATKWKGVIDSGHPLSDGDLFDLGLEILQSLPSKKYPTSKEVTLFSSQGEITIGYFQKDHHSDPTIWIEVPKETLIVVQDSVIKEVYSVFKVDFEKAEEQRISLSSERRLEMAQLLLKAHLTASQRPKAILR